MDSNELYNELLDNEDFNLNETEAEEMTDTIFNYFNDADNK